MIFVEIKQMGKRLVKCTSWKAEQIYFLGGIKNEQHI